MNNYNNPPLIVKAGTYTGNNTANRAIPHGLGRIPSMVFIYITDDLPFFIVAGAIVERMGTAITAVTAINSANFYVGNAGSYTNTANATTVVYHWVAI